MTIQNDIVEDLTLFFKRVSILFLKQFLKQKFGVHFPPISLRTRLCCLNLAGFQTFAFYEFSSEFSWSEVLGSEISWSESWRFLVLHCFINTTAISGRRYKYLAPFWLLPMIIVRDEYRFKSFFFFLIRGL